MMYIFPEIMINVKCNERSLEHKVCPPIAGFIKDIRHQTSDIRQQNAPQECEKSESKIPTLLQNAFEYGISFFVTFLQYCG